jgi:hypothetical protein
VRCNVKSVGVHPQLSHNNGFLRDAVLVASGSLWSDCRRMKLTILHNVEVKSQEFV